MGRTNTGKNAYVRLRLAASQDTFSGRTVSGGWGTASDGTDVWTFPVGTTTRSVSGGVGQITGAASNTIGFLGSKTLTDGEVIARVTATTAASNVMLVLRATSSNTHYRAGLDGSGQITIQKVVGGAATDLASTSYAWVTGTNYWIRFRVQGSTLSLKVWQDGSSSEPTDWSATAFDTAITSPGQFGIRGKPSSSSSSSLYFDSLVVYQALPFSPVETMGIRLMLSANRTPDLHIRVRTLAYALPSVPMRLVIRLIQNLMYGNVLSLINLSAQQNLLAHSRLALFTARVRGVVGRMLAAALVPLDSALRFLLMIPKVAEWTSAPSRFHLAYAQDTFQNRTITSAGGWGSASDSLSGSWTINTIGTVAQVSGGTGQMTGTNASATAFLGSETLTDAEMVVQVSGTNGNANISAILRATAVGTYYRAGLAGTNTISIQKVVSGTATTLVTGSFVWVAGYDYWIRFRCLGTSLLVKVWPDGAREPRDWNLTCTDGTISSAGQFGIRSKTGTVTDTNYFSLLVVTQARPLSRRSNVGARFHLLATGARSFVSHLALSALSRRDTSSRTRVNALVEKDTRVRLLLSAGTSTLLKFLPVRFLLAAMNTSSLSARMSVLPGQQLFAPLRFPLIAFAVKEVMSRFILKVSPLRMSSGRESSTRVRFAYAQDTFARANRTGGWGSTADGLTWSFTSTLALSISSNTGVMTGKGSANMVAFLGTATLADADVRVRTKLSNPGSSTGNADASGVVVRALSTSTYYRAGFSSTGSFVITKVLAGTNTDLATLSAVNPTPSTHYWIRLRMVGQTLAARYWQDGSPEPTTTWQLTATDADIVGAGQFGLRLRMTSSPSATLAFSAFAVIDAAPSNPFAQVLSRLRLSAISAPSAGAPMRLYLTQTLSSPQLKSAVARLTVATAHLGMLVGRVRVAAQVQRDLVGRLPVRAMVARGIGARLLFAYSSLRAFPLLVTIAAQEHGFSQMRLSLEVLLARHSSLRTRVSAIQVPQTVSRFTLYDAFPPPPLTTPPLPDLSSAPSGTPRGETTPVALTMFVTYACNGVPLVQQPLSATAPRLDGGAVQRGASFSILFTNPTGALIAQLPDGATVSLTFALEVGTLMVAPVTLTSLLSQDGTLLTVNCTITTTTVQNTWVVTTQFL